MHMETKFVFEVLLESGKNGKFVVNTIRHLLVLIQIKYFCLIWECGFHLLKVNQH